MKSFLIGIVGSIFCMLLLFSCSQQVADEKQNSHSSGNLRVVSDLSFSPLTKALEQTFEALNPKATIEMVYIPQEKAIKELLEGKTDVIIAGRSLTVEELEIVKAKGLKPKTNQIGLEALVFIVSKEDTITRISEARIKDILTNKEVRTLVCDKSYSGNLVYLQERFQLPKLIANINAAGSDSAVIEYVKSHSGVIGIIGLSLISDYDDPKVKSRLKSIKPLSIDYVDSIGQTVTGYPVQEELATKKYPFIRPIFLINLDGNMNLGTGFANFVASERGQRIILKSGLLPYKMPTRSLLIN